MAGKYKGNYLKRIYLLFVSRKRKRMYIADKYISMIDLGEWLWLWGIQTSYLIFRLIYVHTNHCRKSISISVNAKGVITLRLSPFKRSN